MVIVTCFSFSGCKDNIAVTDEDGNPMNYSDEDLGIRTLDGEEGIFILNKDGTFSPVISDFEGYTESEDASPTRYLWFTENKVEISKLIPVVKKGSKVVFVYNKNENFPANFTLEKYAYRGYTIGLHVFRDEDNSLYLKTVDALSGSYAAKQLEELSDEELYRISRINESESLPYENVDNNMELLLGLDGGEQYNFSFFKGTKFVTFTSIADAQAFQSESMVVLSNPFSKTEKGYFEINLPDNMKDGYYYICGLGMFKYEGGK